METLFGASWRTTLIGGLVAFLMYFSQLGPNLPQTGKEWGVAALSAAIFALGKLSKDYNVTNATVVSPAGVRPETPVEVRTQVVPPQP